MLSGRCGMCPCVNFKYESAWHARESEKHVRVDPEKHARVRKQGATVRAVTRRGVLCVCWSVLVRGIRRWDSTEFPQRIVRIPT